MKVWLIVLLAAVMNAGALAQTVQAPSNALRDARRLAELLTQGDGAGAARMLHPNALAAMGGSQAAAVVLAAGPQASKEKGITIVVTVPSPPPARIEKVGQRLFAIVKTRTWITGSTGSADLNGFWLGVSDDAGVHWRFVVFQDVANAHEDAQALFPEGTGALAFPTNPD